MSWETLAFTFVSCIRQSVAQELDDNRTHVFYEHKFCRRPASEVDDKRKR